MFWQGGIILLLFIVSEHLNGEIGFNVALCSLASGLMSWTLTCFHSFKMAWESNCPARLVSVNCEVLIWSLLNPKHLICSSEISRVCCADQQVAIWLYQCQTLQDIGREEQKQLAHGDTEH